MTLSDLDDCEALALVVGQLRILSVEIDRMLGGELRPPTQLTQHILRHSQSKMNRILDLIEAVQGEAS
jgi:hypothetical protein